MRGRKAAAKDSDEEMDEDEKLEKGDVSVHEDVNFQGLFTTYYMAPCFAE